MSVRSCKRSKMKKIFRFIVRAPLMLLLGADGGEGGEGGTPAGGAEGGAPPPAGEGGGQPEPTYEQLSEQAKELAGKAEELRRSKLTDEERAAEDQAKADAEKNAAEDKAPEEYADFKLPEEMPVDEELLSDFKPVAKELGLSQGKAQQLVDLYATKIAPAMVQRQVDQWNQQLDTWDGERKADKEIGGDKYDAMEEAAQRVVNTLGTPELKEFFVKYGVDHHPEVIRVFARMAQYLKEDDPPAGGSTSGSLSLAQRMYPGMNP